MCFICWVVFNGFYLLDYFQWIISNGLFPMDYFQCIISNDFYLLDYFQWVISNGLFPMDYFQWIISNAMRCYSLTFLEWKQQHYRTLTHLTLESQLMIMFLPMLLVNILSALVLILLFSIPFMTPSYVYPFWSGFIVVHASFHSWSIALPSC